MHCTIFFILSFSHIYLLSRFDLIFKPARINQTLELPTNSHFPLTFNKREKLLVFDPVAPHVNLQRQQQSKEELVLLVQSPCRVLIHLKSHELNDVGDAFTGDGAFGGPVR